MRTELDELEVRAANDQTLAGAGLDQVIKSAIEKTRRHWATMSDQHLAPDAVIGVGMGYAALTRDGEAVYEESGKRHCDLMTVSQAEKLAQREPKRSGASTSSRSSRTVTIAAKATGCGCCMSAATACPDKHCAEVLAKLPIQRGRPLTAS